MELLSRILESNDEEDEDICELDAVIAMAHDPSAGTHLYLVAWSSVDPRGDKLTPPGNRC